MDMTRPSPRHDIYGIAAESERRRPRMRNKPKSHCAGKPSLFRGIDRGHGGRQIRPHFHLDEGDYRAAPRDNIDFTALGQKPHRKDAIALEAKGQHGDPFGPKTRL